jgi:hypothetical protein
MYANATFIGARTSDLRALPIILIRCKRDEVLHCYLCMNAADVILVGSPCPSAISHVFPSGKDYVSAGIARFTVDPGQGEDVYCRERRPRRAQEVSDKCGRFGKYGRMAGPEDREKCRCARSHRVHETSRCNQVLGLLGSAISNFFFFTESELCESFEISSARKLSDGLDSFFLIYGEFL